MKGGDDDDPQMREEERGEINRRMKDLKISLFILGSERSGSLRLSVT